MRESQPRMQPARLSKHISSSVVPPPRLRMGPSAPMVNGKGGLPTSHPRKCEHHWAHLFLLGADDAFAVAFGYHRLSHRPSNDYKPLPWVASHGRFAERVSRGSRPLFPILRGCDLRWWRDCRITGPRPGIARSDVDDLNPQADDGNQPPVDCGGGFQR